jgi:hypothetical protein
VTVINAIAVIHAEGRAGNGSYAQPDVDTVQKVADPGHSGGQGEAL